MTTTITASAADDRERARRTNGQFGFQHHDRAEGIELPEPDPRGPAFDHDHPYTYPVDVELDEIIDDEGRREEERMIASVMVEHDIEASAADTGVKHSSGHITYAVHFERADGRHVAVPLTVPQGTREPDPTVAMRFALEDAKDAELKGPEQARLREQLQDFWGEDYERLEDAVDQF